MLTGRILLTALALVPPMIGAENIRDLTRLAEAGDTRAQYYHGVELIKDAAIIRRSGSAASDLAL